MRFVDGDALQQHFADMQKYERCACNFVGEGGYPATEWYCVEDALENAPTIDAIPVEWLLGKREHCKTTWDIDFYEAVQIILGEWQKEQEAR